MKNRIYQFLSRPYIVVCVMAIAPVLSLADRNFGYFFGLGVVGLLLWSSHWDWSRFGWEKRLTWRTAGYALLIALATFVLVD
ncbi:MAG: hypothetical protein WA952_14175, partial [Lewinella sp.]